MHAKLLLFLLRRHRSVPVKVLVRKQKFLEKKILNILLGGYKLFLASRWDSPDYQNTFLKIKITSDILKLFYEVPQLNVQISLGLFSLLHAKCKGKKQ